VTLLLQGCSIKHKVQSAHSVIKKTYHIIRGTAKRQSHEKAIQEYKDGRKEIIDRYLKIQIRKGDKYIKKLSYKQARKAYLTSFFISPVAGDILKRLRNIPVNMPNNKKTVPQKPENLIYKTLDIRRFLEIKSPQEMFEALMAEGELLQKQGKLDRAQGKYLAAFQTVSSEKLKEHIMERIKSIDLLKLKNKAAVTRAEAIDAYYAGNYEEAREKIERAFKLDADNEENAAWYNKIMH